MSTKEGLPVTIFDTHVRVPNGLGSWKNVSLKDFQQEIARVAAGEEQTATPKLHFRLPNETVSISHNLHEMDLLMYFPEAKREVRYSTSKFTIPFPATLILVKLKSNGKGGWMVESVRWLCTSYLEDEVPDLGRLDFTPRQYNNRLWTLPFPNQYGDGNMCVGRNAYRSLYTNDLRGLNELFHHILIASPFNDDLWHVGSRGLTIPGRGDGAKAWFTFLSRQETFPWANMPGFPQTVNVNVSVEAADDTNFALEADDEEDEDDNE